MGYLVVAYIIALIGDALLAFLSVYHVIAFDELKTDFKNPIKHCKIMNSQVIPEYGLHFIITLLFLAGGDWMAVLINLPLFVYNFNRLYQVYVRAPKHKPFIDKISSVYDPTTIMNSNQLALATKEGWIKLMFNLFAFFFYIYGLISTLIAAEA